MMTMPDADFLFRIADAAAGQTLPRFRQKLAIDNKVPGAFDPVTEADRQAERAITALIAAEFPDQQIESLTCNVQSTADVDALIERMIDFAVAGFQGPHASARASVPETASASG